MSYRTRHKHRRPPSDPGNPGRWQHCREFGGAGIHRIIEAARHLDTPKGVGREVKINMELSGTLETLQRRTGFVAQSKYLEHLTDKQELSCHDS